MQDSLAGLRECFSPGEWEHTLWDPSPHLPGAPGPLSTCKRDVSKGGVRCRKQPLAWAALSRAAVPTSFLSYGEFHLKNAMPLSLSPLRLSAEGMYLHYHTPSHPRLLSWPGPFVFSSFCCPITVVIY